MNTSTFRQLFRCGTSGRGTMLVSPGMCRKCKEEWDALDQLYDFNRHRRVAPQRWGGFMYGVMNCIAIALLIYILWNFVSLFTEWWTAGGRPWQ